MQSFAVESAKRDLHSGVFGGSVHECMTDLVKVMASLVDVTGKVVVCGAFRARARACVCVCVCVCLLRPHPAFFPCAGHINVPGIYADVAPLLPEEAALYTAVDFDFDEFRRGVGVAGKLLHETKEELLQHRWRNPTLSLHGIEGAFSGSGEKTVLPGARACLPVCVPVYV
jgi:nonspecific dipeptidase